MCDLMCMCVCADLGQSLCEAGRLSLGKRQEEGLLPERSESWNITIRKEMSSDKGCKVKTIYNYIK